jgi:hypothetical protein
LERYDSYDLILPLPEDWEARQSGRDGSLKKQPGLLIQAQRHNVCTRSHYRGNWPLSKLKHAVDDFALTLLDHARRANLLRKMPNILLAR